MKNFKYIIFGMLLASTCAVAAGKLNNSNFATPADITGAGGTIAELLNTSKIYDSTNTQLLDTTIAGKFNSAAFTDAAVTSKILTGYVSGAGVVAATDTILQAIQKLNGNVAAVTAITDLTGDVTATGPGSAAATIANLAVTNAKIANSTIDLTAKVTGILPNANTTATSANTASAIVARDASGDFSAGIISAALSGNASTATALAANPADCGAGTKATAIAANGDLTCSAVADADISAGVDAAKIADGTVSNAEFQYISSLTSNAQTQIDAKFTLPALTSGSIVFSNGTTLAQDNANLFFDDTNNRLGIGTASPGYREHIVMAAAGATDSITWEGSGAGASRKWNWMPDSSGYLYMKNLNESYYSMVFTNAGLVGFGTSAPVAQLNVVPRTASVVGAIVKGFASQTADLMQWQNSAATVLAKVDVTGKAFFPNLNVSSVTSSLPAKFDASKNITSGAIDLASAEVTGTLPNANTTATSANTASAIVARDASGNFSAGTVTASLSGNASTATALAANPTDCGAGTKATAIDASGNLTCSAVSLTADVSGVLPAANLPAPTTSAIGASDIDWSTLKNVDGLYTKTLSANTTLTFSNVTAGQTIVIAITNTASNYTLAWPAAAKWSGGTTPTQTIGAKTDVYTCKAYDSTNAYCSAVQNF